MVDFSPVPSSDEQAIDICAADRRLFFAVLKAGCAGRRLFADCAVNALMG